MKTCSKCKIEKNLFEFNKRESSKDGFHQQCKRCLKKYKDEWYQNNKTSVVNRVKRYYDENKKQILEGCKKWRENNKEKVKKIQKKYREKNKEKIKKKSIEYNKKNKEKIKGNRKKKHLSITKKKCKSCYIVGDYTKFKEGRAICKKCMNAEKRKRRQENREEANRKERECRKRNPQKRIHSSMSASIRHSLKGNKKGNKWEDLVGYTLEDLVNRLESLFEPWMNWGNYGVHDPNGPRTWQIDHIIPKSMFKFDSYEDEEFKLCWSLFNLQPKCSYKNNCKQNKFIG